jgi:hypothetical protein
MKDNKGSSMADDDDGKAILCCAFSNPETCFAS